MSHRNAIRTFHNAHEIRVVTDNLIKGARVTINKGEKYIFVFEQILTCHMALNVRERGGKEVPIMPSR